MNVGNVGLTIRVRVEVGALAVSPSRCVLQIQTDAICRVLYINPTTGAKQERTGVGGGCKQQYSQHG